MRSTSLFASSLANVRTGGALRKARAALLSVEGTVTKRAAGMPLCQRRQPPKAVAAGQRLQSRIPAATISRGARGAVQSPSRWTAHCPPQYAIWCALWYRRLARATAWQRARLEDEGFAAQPLSRSSFCGARAPCRWSASLPLADEVLVCALGLPCHFSLPLAEFFDVVGVSWTSLVALLGRHASLQFH